MKNYIKTNAFIVTLLLITTTITSATQSQAQSSAKSLLDSDPQSISRGLGHYERARSLLLAAVREFDSGYSYVKTDQVLEANVWRKTILSRAEELETILSPKPRELKAGSNYQPDSRLLGARVKPKANIKPDPIVKPEISKKPEAKVEVTPIQGKEGIDLEISGS